MDDFLKTFTMKKICDAIKGEKYGIYIEVDEKHDYSDYLECIFEILDYKNNSSSLVFTRKISTIDEEYDCVLILFIYEYSKKPYDNWHKYYIYNGDYWLDLVDEWLKHNQLSEKAIEMCKDLKCFQKYLV